jgi:hypothetical protein
MGLRVGLLGFAALGLVLAAIGFALGRQTRRFLRTARTARGNYVGDVARSTLTSTRQTSYALIEFTTETGRIVRFEGRVGNPFARRSDEVAVRYDPEDPDHAVVASTVETWGPAVIFGATGLLLFAFAIVAMIVDELT